ncbi:MAG: DUF2877 domain-containing protein [Sphingomonadaceae bacterium]
MLRGRELESEGPRLSTADVLQIGERAREALARGGGFARPLAGFPDAPYLEADGEVIWVGARLPARHPRAVLTTAAPPRGVALRFVSLPEHGWLPRLPALSGADGPRELLRGMRPRSPRGLPASRVQALAAAYLRDDPHEVFAATLPLLGVGSGFTPSGDDLAGAALFGRRWLAPEAPQWRETAESLAREAGTRSHAVSAALFADLARGESFEPLHALGEALACGSEERARSAVQALTAIGHSSGCDMLAGLAIGMGIAQSDAT